MRNQSKKCVAFSDRKKSKSQTSQTRRSRRTLYKGGIKFPKSNNNKVSRRHRLRGGMDEVDMLPLYQRRHFDAVEYILYTQNIYKNSTAKQKSDMRLIYEMRTSPDAYKNIVEPVMDEKFYQDMIAGEENTRNKPSDTKFILYPGVYKHRDGSRSSTSMNPKTYERFKSSKERFVNRKYEIALNKKIFESRGNTDNMGDVHSYLTRSPYVKK